MPIYLDHNATTSLHPDVRKSLAEALDLYGNPSSLHTAGRQTRQVIEEARSAVAEFLVAARPEEIVFTGSGTEANNTVLRTFGVHNKRGQILVSAIEHPCVLECAKAMADAGAAVEYVPVQRDGRLDQDALREKLRVKTALVSVMLANNETGTIQDLAEVVRLAHEAGALVHTDAVQAFGKIPVDVGSLGVDYLTFSAHKIYGPKGVGGMYVRNGAPLQALLVGGHQENGRRAGTENVLGIVGLQSAVQARQREMATEADRLCALRRELARGLRERVSDLFVNGHEEETLPGTLSVSFAGTEGEALLLYLDLEGIQVSTGSACASGSLEPSHVLRAMQVPLELAHGSIRFSLGRDTSEEEINRTVDAVAGVVAKVRRLSGSASHACSCADGNCRR